MLEKTRENMLGMALRVAAETGEMAPPPVVQEPEPVAASPAPGVDTEAAASAGEAAALTGLEADTPAGTEVAGEDEAGDGVASAEPPSPPQVLSPAIRMSPGTRRSIDLDPPEPEEEGVDGAADDADTPPDPDPEEQGGAGEPGVASWRRVRASYAGSGS